MTILGNGVYGFAEASRLTGLKRARIKEWFRVRPADDGAGPVFRGDYEPVDNDQAISFLDLVEVFVAGQLREHGVSLQTLRRVHSRLQADLGVKHPFSRQEILSDGKQVFARGLDEKGRDELSVVLTGQRVFPEILLPFLKSINYDKATKLARQWRIAEQVVVDPAICFGKPVVEAVGIPTAILASAYRANGEDARLVADWYEVRPEHVIAAVNFEGRLAA